MGTLFLHDNMGEGASEHALCEELLPSAVELSFHFCIIVSNHNFSSLLYILSPGVSLG